MKKIAVTALALLLVCSLSACKGDGEGKETGTQTGDESYKIESTTAPVTTAPVVTDAVTTPDVSETTPPPTPGTTAAPSLTFTPADKMVYAAVGSVWIRSAPDLSEASKVATLNFGESLRCVGMNDTWYKVIYGDKECYVSAAFLTTDNLNISLDARNETVYVIVDVATVRKGPSTKTDPMGYLKKGDSLIRTGISADWSQVSYDGGSYFVHNSCLDIKPAG